MWMCVNRKYIHIHIHASKDNFSYLLHKIYKTCYEMRNFGNFFIFIINLNKSYFFQNNNFKKCESQCESLREITVTFLLRILLVVVCIAYGVCIVSNQGEVRLDKKTSII